MLKNKKGFSEITSFVLLFSIIAIASTIAYTFSKNVIDEKVSEIDLQNAQNYLKKIDQKMLEIKHFQGGAFSVNLNFKQGTYKFEDDKLYYHSLTDYTGDPYCINSICHENTGGTEKIYITLDNSYIFNENFSLIPGNYFLTFINLKNETKIDIKIS